MSDAASDYSKHFKVVCRCGSVISQCRCPAPFDKEVRISPKPCNECKEQAAKIPAPPPPPAPTPPSDGLTKENYKHIDEVVALYNFACQACKKLEVEAKEATVYAEELKTKVLKASKDMDAIQDKLRTAYREKEKMGNTLLKAAGQ